MDDFDQVAYEIYAAIMLSPQPEHKEEHIKQIKEALLAAYDKGAAVEASCR